MNKENKMNKNNGQGYGQHDMSSMTVDVLSKTLYVNMVEQSLVPNIAHADADFGKSLTEGDKVKFFVNYDAPNTELWQRHQENEATEPDVINLKTVELQLCNTRSIDIKLSVTQLRDLENHGVDSIYFSTVQHQIRQSLETLWDESHLAHLLMMTAKENTGNRAIGQFNLGSPDNPILVPQDSTKKAEVLFETFNSMESVLAEHHAAKLDGSTFLILPNRVYSAGRHLFTEHNTCCGKDNIVVTGRMPQTILGFDAFRTNRRVLSTHHNGRDIYYLILGNKKSNGFVSDIYNMKWHEEKRDWFLVGTEVHGSYVTNPYHFAIAVVAFE